MAVLPIQEDELFRAERAELRAQLAYELARRAPDHAIVPLAQVDLALRPISSKTGARCAFEDAPAARRASNAGWLHTGVMHVGGLQPRSEELWVELRDWHHRSEATFTSPWDPRLGLFARYRGAFASLQRNDDVGALGGLGATGSAAGSIREGAVTLCESRSFSACGPESSAWRDRIGDLAACYPDADDVSDELLIEGGSTPARCELTNLDDLQGKSGRREMCLCKILSSSAGVRAKLGRRIVRVHYEALDLHGKPRPEVRAVDVTTNLHADVDWHSMKTEVDGRSVHASVHRLVVDNLDALVAPLSRCPAAPGSTIVAEMDIADNGAVQAARVAGAGKKDVIDCVEKASSRGAFTCTGDGKPATLRVALTWPANKP